jgi:nitroreductase
MMEKDLYPAIFRRRSVRKYDPAPLDAATLGEIRTYVNGLVPLRPDIATEFRLLVAADVKTRLAVKAPHYVAVSAEAKDGALTHVGFMLQQLELFLSVNGIGACYLGMARPEKEALDGMRHEFVILLAFGRAAEGAPHRVDRQEFDRRQPEDVSRVDGAIARQVVEAARFAPSAVNSQPWRFAGSDASIRVYCAKPNPLTALVMGRVNKIDMGIALCHLWVAAEHFGKQASFTFDAAADGTPAEKTPAGHYYVATLNMG